MNPQFYERIASELGALEQGGLKKPKRILSSAQGGSVVVDGRTVINLCANNYLGLAGDERVITAGIDALRRWGAGLASVRFICGTQEIHKELEATIADYLGFEDAILFAAAFDANGGVFEPLLGAEDAIISDSLNHASIIDGVRLCKAKRYRFENNNMDELDRQLAFARSNGARTILIATDGVFSMDGSIADLGAITALAAHYGALVLVDDCHATGLVGPGGRGSAAYCGVEGKIDILTGTFGKALGGAMGGFVAAPRSVVDLLRQRARPYLFSNSLTPSICGLSLKAIEIAASAEGDSRRQTIADHATRFRNRLSTAGFDLRPGKHPIIPVMVGEADTAQRLAAALLEGGILATGFSFPVVPHGSARIRTQMSAALTSAEIDQAASIFIAVGRAQGIIR